MDLEEKFNRAIDGVYNYLKTNGLVGQMDVIFHIILPITRLAEIGIGVDWIWISKKTAHEPDNDGLTCILGTIRNTRHEGIVAKVEARNLLIDAITIEVAGLDVDIIVY